MNKSKLVLSNKDDNGSLNGVDQLIDQDAHCAKCGDWIGDTTYSQDGGLNQACLANWHQHACRDF